MRGLGARLSLMLIALASTACGSPAGNSYATVRELAAVGGDDLLPTFAPPGTSQIDVWRSERNHVVRGRFRFTVADADGLRASLAPWEKKMPPPPQGATSWWDPRLRRGSSQWEPLRTEGWRYYQVKDALGAWKGFPTPRGLAVAVDWPAGQLYYWTMD